MDFLPTLLAKPNHQAALRSAIHHALLACAAETAEFRRVIFLTVSHTHKLSPLSAETNSSRATVFLQTKQISNRLRDGKRPGRQLGEKQRCHGWRGVRWWDPHAVPPAGPRCGRIPSPNPPVMPAQRGWIPTAPTGMLQP